MAKRDDLLRLYALAEAKGFDVTQSMMRDHVRLIDSDGNLVKNKNGGTAFSYAEARRYLDETLMDTNLPFAIDAISWRDLSAAKRGTFFCFQEKYLPLPAVHEEQIKLLTRESAKRFWKWYDFIPRGWPEGQARYLKEDKRQLDEADWNTEDGVQAVRQWLHDLGIPYSRIVYLVYEQNKIVQMPWKLVVKYWDALSWSIGHQMEVVDHTKQWACCFFHEDVIVYGTNIGGRNHVC